MNVKSDNSNKVFGFIFILFSIIITATSWAVWTGYQAQRDCAVVANRLDVWQAQRLEQIKNTDILLVEIRVEMKELSLEVKRLNIEIAKKNGNNK